MIPAVTSVRRRRRCRRRQLLDSPYIVNGTVSTTLLTKKIHKSHRRVSIDMETFHHVLNNDYCSLNAIIIFSFWFEWMCCQCEGRHEAGAIREAELWLTATKEEKAKWVAGGIFMWSGRWKVAVKKCTGYLLFCLSAGWRWIKVEEHVEPVRLPFHLLPKWVWGLESAVYPLHSAWQRNNLKLTAEETALCHQRQRSNQLFTCCCSNFLLHISTLIPVSARAPFTPAPPPLQECSAKFRWKSQ